ncbi:MAG TPA: hypothetical protein DEB40_07915 [Elusimicrobia bacterium]|nr:hypothetical protein [Elusimicrobiota bacterium]HBT61655.1 hypothetical protein [Elusimicrobiota bacterium]
MGLGVTGALGPQGQMSVSALPRAIFTRALHALADRGGTMTHNDKAVEQQDRFAHLSSMRDGPKATDLVSQKEAPEPV